MKRREILIGGFLMLVPSMALSSGKSFPKKHHVSGKVVDFDRRLGIVVLTEYKDWDREQMTVAHMGAKSATKRWLDGVDPKDSVIYLKPDHVAKLKKGDRIKIAEYSYSMLGYGNGAGADVMPIYDKLEISPK